MRNSHVWFNALPALIANYNARPSRALALNGRLRAPADIGGEEEEAVRELDYKRAVAVRDATDDSEIEPGSRVRLQLSKTKAFAKSKFSKANEHSWTTDVYVVLARAGPNSFD